MLAKNDAELLRMAYKKATESPDSSTQNGAVIPFHQSAYLAACNTFPPGVSGAVPERLQRPLKYAFVEHAERGVLHAALRQGVYTVGLTMYCPWFACADCARAIIGAGISRVVGHQQMMDLTPDHWKDTIGHAFAMFAEAKVETVLYSGKLNGPAIRMNGQLWEP